jgi:hypothetical protein
MKTTNKLKFLQGLKQQVESHLSQAVNTFKNLNEHVLNQQAENGGWSICQCLEHLNTYSRYYLPRLELCVSRATKANPEFFSVSWLGSYFQAMMDPDKSSKKFKAVSKHMPGGTNTGYEVVAEFIDNQERLLRVLVGCEDIDLNVIKIATSISSFIRLSAGDTLAFLITHDERHIRQANKNLAFVASCTRALENETTNCV